MDTDASHEPGTDEHLVGQIVDRAYELISFAAGGQPAWDDFRTLFTQPCVLALRVFPADPAVTVMDMDAYIRTQMRDGLLDNGYTEVPGNRNTSITGEVGAVHQQFAMQFAAGTPIPAIDVFSLARIDGEWRIVSIVSDTESRTHNAE